MKSQYLIRLDDASPYMDSEKWNRIKDILDKYRIKPLVGVIPDCQYKPIMKSVCEKCLWDVIKSWEASGWSIALHGLTHEKNTREGGANPSRARSEYAGLPYERQAEMILQGIQILNEKGLHPNYFFAPFHTFDDATIEALRNNTSIHKISDTIAFGPYMMNGVLIIPAQFTRFHNILIPGIWTFCFHPNFMDEREMIEFEKFIKRHHRRFISFDEIIVGNYGLPNICDKILNKIYYFLRKFL